MTNPLPSLPFKSVAAALLFTIIVGPVGLLYASFWGGILMISLFLLSLHANFLFIIFLIWMISCIWSVGAVESFNRQLLKKVLH